LAVIWAKLTISIFIFVLACTAAAVSSDIDQRTIHTVAGYIIFFCTVYCGAYKTGKASKYVTSLTGWAGNALSKKMISLPWADRTNLIDQ
jgi:hypothetical protein